MQTNMQDAVKDVLKVGTNVTNAYVAPGKEFDAIKEFFVSGQVKDFLNFIIKAYMDCFFKSLGKNSLQKAEFRYEDDPAKGYYSKANSLICINLKYYKFSEVLDFAVTLFRFCNGKEDSLKRIMKTTLYQDVFDESIKGSATSTLTHELEHARRNDATCHGAHTDRDDPDGNKVNFNACARSWMCLAIEKGFKETWYEQIKENAAKNAADKFKDFLIDDSKFKDWTKFLKQFKKLEETKPNIAKELGF